MNTIIYIVSDLYLCLEFIKTKIMGEIKVLILTNTQRFVQEEGFRNDNTHYILFLIFQCVCENNRIIIFFYFYML